MKHRSFVLNLLLSGMLVLAVAVTGCGGGGDQQENDQGSNSEATSESGGNEASGGVSGGGQIADVYGDIATTIEGVNSKEDVDKADSRLGDLYNKLYDRLKAEMHNPSDAATSSANSQNMQAMDRRIQVHMEKLSRERPDVAMLLGASIAKNGMKLAGLAGEAMEVGAKEMDKAMEEMKKMSGGK